MRATANQPAPVSQRFLSVGGGPKETRNQQVFGSKPLLETALERIVPKSVVYGELFGFAELPPTHGFTHDAESFRSRRLSFFRLSRKDLRRTACVARFSTIGCPAPPNPRTARSRATLSRSRFGRPLWVNDVVGFGGQVNCIAPGMESSGSIHKLSLKSKKSVYKGLAPTIFDTVPRATLSSRVGDSPDECLIGKLGETR